ncbi:MAG: DUF1553 domain-containing protein [Planctomycetes bacterium]|nr:DUF1553 domain-containing protein [Planctomycetota bacterium]
MVECKLPFVAHISWLLVALTAIPVLAADPPAEPAAKLDFESRVLPILKARCVRCHAGAEPANGLKLTSRKEILAGGKSGPAIRVAAAESSLIWEKLTSNQMPKDGPPLTIEEKGIIRAWINEGAISADADDSATVAAGEPSDEAKTNPGDHWSLQPVRRSIPPTEVRADRMRDPIDAWVLNALEGKGLSLAEEASRVVLLRRYSLSLRGVPPVWDEIEEYLADDSPDASERVVDRLLASPEYGERWGRHWLDIAGYADSAGVLSEDRPLQTSFRYRDYVIRAFNDDKPYDRFLQEQIAGDELSDYWNAYETMEQLPAHVIEAVTATGFLRCAPDASRPDFSTIKNADAQYFYPTINDTLQILSSSILGTTVQCARCHSHKFDPISQTEYYRLQAIFMSAYRPRQWVPQMERRILVATASQKKVADEVNAAIDADVAKWNAELTELRATFKKKLFDQRLETLPEPIRADLRQAFSRSKEERGEIDKYLYEKFKSLLEPADAALEKALDESYPDYREEAKQRRTSIDERQKQRRHFDEIRALYDLPGPVTTPLLRRGDALMPGPPVEPGVPAAFAAPASFDWQNPPEGARTSGRRLAFARWLTQSGHPLPARVLVNRVWLQQFGLGIVATPEDFGVLGAPPSHPRLLDELASTFVDQNWSIKRLQRRIALSSTYRQISNVDAATRERASAVDPENRLLWRQRLRRLEAEPLRDSMLAAAGMLDRRMFGAPTPVMSHPNGEVTTVPGPHGRRRSIYIQVLRGNPLTLLHAHDQPVMETNCVRRGVSTVSTQALTLLNSDTVLEYARGFADHLLHGGELKTVERAIQIALARDPLPDDLADGEEFLAAQRQRYAARGDAPDVARRNALADLCQLLLASNEFAYLD